jgi:ABC-type multidrug transport system fused ATPase/permease subunit
MRGGRLNEKTLQIPRTILDLRRSGSFSNVPKLANDPFQPKLLEEIIDVGIMNQDLDVIVSAGSKMLMTTFVAVLRGIGCVIFSSIAAQNAGADIRRSIFTKVQYLSRAKLDKYGTDHLSQESQMMLFNFSSS